MTAFERHLLRWSGWATGLTGLLYLWMKHALEPSEPWAAVNHPLQPILLKAHILVAPVLVFALGTISVSHVWRHWLCRVPGGRRTGVTLALLVGPMIVTGYLVQVLTHPGRLSFASWSHVVLGVLYLVGFTAHTTVFRKGRRRRQGRRSEGERRRGRVGGDHSTVPRPRRGGARDAEAG